MFENDFFNFDTEKPTEEERYEQLKQICFKDGNEYIVPNRFQQLKLFNLALYLEKLADKSGGDTAVIMPSIGYHGTVVMFVDELIFKNNEDIVSFAKQVSNCKEFSFDMGMNNKLRISFEVPYVYNKRRSSI